MELFEEGLFLLLDSNPDIPGHILNHYTDYVFPVLFLG